MKYIDLDLNGKSVLITGGAGFVGSNVAFHIQENYPEAQIVIFDAFVLGHFKNLQGIKGEAIAGDITDPVDMQSSWMIGDKESDIKAALTAGVGHTILVRTGHKIDEANTKASFVFNGVFDTIGVIK